MSKHILRLHIESPGTLYSPPGGDTTSSAAGHTWFEVVSPELRGLCLESTGSDRHESPEKQGDILPLDNMDDFMLLFNLKVLAESRFPIPIDDVRWNSPWIRRTTAISVETNFWKKDPEGTITVSPLGETIEPNGMQLNENSAATMAMWEARFSPGMGNDFTTRGYPGSSLQMFETGGIRMGSMFSSPCGRDYIPTW